MSCWEHLGIAPTDDQNSIRSAYRARLPDVHPERDPEGFQALRGAYEDALRQARGEVPATSEGSAPPSASEQAVQQFVELLQDAGRRFRPEAWQDYCRMLDQLPLDVLEGLDGSLRGLLLSNGPLSHRCVNLLTERMAWANRLMQMPFEEAEALDQLLQRIAEPDPFDLASLSDWPTVAQVENLWYVRTLEHLFRNRPLQEFRGWCSLHLCLPMPADPDYYPRLYRQCTLAGVALGGALEHYQALHDETPDDLDIQYLLALQKQHHDLDALDLWTRLWHEREIPEAAAWMLAWCAHHSPERLPLLILAFNRSQIELGHEHPLDAYQLADGEPAQTPQTLARWQRAAISELPPLARTFIAWQMGDSEWPFLAELLGAADTPLTRLYRQAWLLQRGDEADPVTGEVRQLEYNKETIAIRQDGSLTVSALMHRPLRAAKPWRFGFKGCVPEAYEATEGQCVLHQLVAVTRKSLKLDEVEIEGVFDGVKGVIDPNTGILKEDTKKKDIF